MKAKILEIDKFCEAHDDRVHLLMTVHDAIEGQYEEGHEGLFEQVLAIFEDVQSEPYNLRVPFVAEGHVGKNWAEATFGKEA